ncbi:hypothetical protein COU54_03050 [Candidatus Pacearchaeota archaeon CG10_big_fil_rev_8_21_14_0_10_31_24]|nr:MAG: hypothetical protein COU54_03050 [Candidatus Pacearchaeota archaeon CG10_big_fil_rev_8_21_14_0_10_31_24]
MIKKELVLITALAKNRVIGHEGKIPWHDNPELKREDFRHFIKLTLNKPIIMGRKTHESIGKVLPLRTNIVISKQGSCLRGASIFKDLESALDFAYFFNNEVYIIGGQQLYEQTINRATRLELTEIEKDYPGDTFFPRINEKTWKEKSKEPREGYSFVTYTRR